MAHTTEMTLDQVIDSIGLGRFQHKLLAVAGVSWAADAMEVLLIGFLIPSIIVSLHITREQAAWLVTALFVGMMLGAWFWGSLADRIGRKNVFVYTILIASVFALASALAPNYETLLLFRLLSGFGIGGSLPVDYAITAEFMPSRQRGRWLVFLESFWALGTIVAAGLAWFFIPRFPEDGWRYVLALSAVPGLIAFWIRRSIPESPRYLVTRGRTAEAEQVVKIVAAENGVTLPDDFRLIAPVATTASAQIRQPLAVIFQSPLLRSTLLLSAVWFLLSLAYYGIFTWLPGIFVQRGFDFLRTYQNTFILALAQLPGYFSAAWLIEKWGRKPTLAVYLGAAAVFTYAFAVADSLPLIVKNPNQPIGQFPHGRCILCTVGARRGTRRHYIDVGKIGILTRPGWGFGHMEPEWRQVGTLHGPRNKITRDNNPPESCRGRLQVHLPQLGNRNPDLPSTVPCHI